MEENVNEATSAENPNQAVDEGGNGQATTAAPTVDNTPVEQKTDGVELPKENLLTQATVDSEGEQPKSEEATEEQGEKEGPSGAPDTYDDFKAPEGVKFDSEVIDSFKEVAKEANLTQEDAQKLLDKVSPVLARRQVEQIAAVNQGWIERSKADKELSADWDRSMSDIARVRDRFARNDDGSVDADIAEFMSLPIGNHPGVLKLLARAGRAISEAGFPQGTPSGSGKISPADFYNSAKK